MRSASRRSGGIFDIDRKLIQLEEEEEKTKDPKFWDDPKAAEVQLKLVAGIKEWITAYKQVESTLEDLHVVLDFMKEGEASEDDVDQQYKTTLTLVEELEFKNMLRNEADKLGAIVKINAGAGGYREPGLGIDAHAYVYALWRAKQLQDQRARLP